MSNAHTSRISITDLAAKKKAGQKWAMLTCYEQITAEIFDEAGIPVLLVGDSAGNNFLGFENTIPVTVDELIPLARAVVTASQKAMVVADFPFGSYESSPDQALATGVRFFKEAKVVGKLCKPFFALFPQRMIRVFDHFMQQLIQAIDDGVSQFFVKASPAHDRVGPFLNHFADEMFIGLQRCRRPFDDTVEHRDMPPFADHRAQ